MVASWFLRRSGSRVSILIACRRNVPVALSLCVNPMPSRITRKSTRPRVADRTMVDTVQPRVLASFRNRSALSLLMNMQLLRWSKAKPETTGQDTRLERHSYLTRDWMPRTITRASGGGRRMFLTSPLIEQALAQACAVSSPPPKGLPDSIVPIRQHGLQGQVLAVTTETITSGPLVGMAEPSKRAKWRALRSAWSCTLKKCLTGIHIVRDAI